MIIFNNQVFYDAQEINLTNGLIDLIATKDGGTYFSCIPISNEDFRQKYNSRYKVEYREGFYFDEYKITDDWGEHFILCISHEHHKILKQLREQLIYKK